MTAPAEAFIIEYTAIVTKTLRANPRMHGGVTTSPGTTAERSYRRFISTITRKNSDIFGIVPMNRSTKRKRL